MTRTRGPWSTGRPGPCFFEEKGLVPVGGGISARRGRRFAVLTAPGTPSAGEASAEDSTYAATTCRRRARRPWPACAPRGTGGTSAAAADRLHEWPETSKAWALSSAAASSRARRCHPVPGPWQCATGPPPVTVATPHHPGATVAWPPQMLALA